MNQSLYGILLFVFISSYCHAQQFDYYAITSTVPQGVYDAANKIARSHCYECDTINRVGTAIRYFDGIYENEIISTKTPVRQILEAKAKTTHPVWIVPIFQGNKYNMIIRISKTSKDKPFEEVGGGGGDGFEYALEEISQIWSESKGFHPVIVNIDNIPLRDFLFIPEVSYDNFTFIAYARWYPFGRNFKSVKKSNYLKSLQKMGLNDSTKKADVDNLNKQWSKDYANVRKNPSLQKKAIESSDYNTVSKSEDTRKWWIALKIPSAS